MILLPFACGVMYVSLILIFSEFFSFRLFVINAFQKNKNNNEKMKTYEKQFLDFKFLNCFWCWFCL